MKKEIEQLVAKLQSTSFSRGMSYAEDCERGMSGEMSEHYAPAQHYDRQEFIGKLMALLDNG